MDSNALCHNFLIPAFIFIPFILKQISSFHPGYACLPSLSHLSSHPAACSHSLVFQQGSKKRKMVREGGRRRKWHYDKMTLIRERGRLRYSENDRHGVIRAWQGTAGGEEYWVKQWRVERKRERDEESEAVSCHLLLCVCRDTETVLWHCNNAMTTAFHSMIAVYLLPTGSVCFRLFANVSLTSLTIHWIGNFSIINVCFYFEYASLYLCASVAKQGYIKLDHKTGNIDDKKMRQKGTRCL